MGYKSTGRYVDIAGKRFGRLVAVRPHDQTSRWKWRWLCQCDCGNEHIVRGSDLTSSKTRSCGCVQHRQPDATIRFETNYIPEPNSGCWLWLGATLGKGYGQMQLGRSADKQERLAHRVAWRLFKGPIPEGLDVLHHCDVPSCVNPDHLFLGTDFDNMKDMRDKGRDRFEEAMLTIVDIEDIKRRSANGETLKQLAKAYSVSTTTIHRARHDHNYPRKTRNK